MKDRGRGRSNAWGWALGLSVVLALLIGFASAKKPPKPPPGPDPADRGVIYFLSEGTTLYETISSAEFAMLIFSFPMTQTT